MYVKPAKLFVLPALAATIYAVLVIAIAYFLAFPGFGVILLPQPILKLYLGGKTLFYDVLTPYTALWIAYLLITHIALYQLASLARLRRPYLIVAPLLYVTNLALVLVGLCDYGLLHYVHTYTLGYLAFVPGVLLTLVLELVGYRLGSRVI